jgi:hypothetical protein
MVNQLKNEHFPLTVSIELKIRQYIIDYMSSPRELPLDIPYYVSSDEDGIFVRMATTINELPCSELRRFALETAKRRLGLHSADLDTPIYLSMCMTRQQMLMDPRPYLSLPGGDLPLGLFWQ